MPTVTYQNSDTYISVVAWIFILLGAYGVYTSLGQLILTILFYPAPSILNLFTVVLAVSLPFSAASLWCGFGLRRRSRSALKAFIVLLFLYVLWTIGLSTWMLVDDLLMSPPAEFHIAEFLDRMEQSARYGLAQSIFSLVTSILTSAICFWLMVQFSSRAIRHEFANQ